MKFAGSPRTAAALVLSACVLSALASACGNPSARLDEPFAVVQTSPTHGAIDVAPDTELRIGFNRAVDFTSVAGVVVRASDTGAEVATQSVLQSDDVVLTLVPVQPLPSGTSLALEVPADAADLTGVTLGSKHITRFVTRVAP